MSHSGPRQTVMRAIFAAVLAFALSVSLIGSGAASTAHAAAMEAAGVGMSGPCPHMAHIKGVQGTPSPSGGHSKLFACPDCCLGGHSSAAVLPQRHASYLEPFSLVASPTRYFALSAHMPKPVDLASVNGARAPPRFFS